MAKIAEQLAACTAQLTHPGSPFELITETRDGIEQRCYKNAPQTLDELIAPGRDQGDNPFLVYEGERWSFQRFFTEADTLTAQLVHRYGVKPGDRVAIAMRNLPEWMVAFIAITGAGAIAVPLNSWGQGPELTYALEDAGARLLFCDAQRLALTTDYLQHSDSRAIVARPGDAALPVHACDYQALIAEPKPRPDIQCQPDDPVMIMYTSGTTGRPKGALSTHRSLCQAVFNFDFQAALAGMTSPEAVAAITASGFAPTPLLSVPLFHVSGLHAVFLTSLRGGRKMVMMYKWDTDKALELIASERVTSLGGVPTLSQALLSSPKFVDTDTTSLFGLGGGGAAMSPQLNELIYRLKPNALVGTGYGMTETNATGSSCAGDAYRYQPRSVGTVSPIVDIDIRDDQGRTLPPGEQGTIWIKSPTLMQAYWNKPDATAETLQNGWLDSGDIGYRDSEGFLFLVDRAKDMVLRGGENIYPAEIEACIRQHPAVAEVTAFGIPHPELGEALVAAIFTRAAQWPSDVEIQQHVSEQLARFKVPSRVIIQGEDFPRTASGKVQKKQVRADYLQTLTKAEPEG